MASETKITRFNLTFCVSVVVKRAEKKCTVVKKQLKRIPTCNTWEDLFNDAIINISNFRKTICPTISSTNTQRSRPYLLADTVKLSHNGEYCPVGPMKAKSLIPQGPKEFRLSKNFVLLFPKPVCLKTLGQYGNPNRGQFSQL